jgi:hypothetical protein
MPTIHLICEDETDADIVKAILQKKLPEVRVSHIPLSGGSGGISRLANQLGDLVERVRELRQKGDCIAVLHDADEHTARHRSSDERIKTICQKYEHDVYLAIAKDAIEAWLLADEGLCKWLGIRAKNNDEDPRPKDTLRSQLRKSKNLKWQGPDRAKVLAQIDGTGDKHSPSMRSAVSHINC